MPQPDGRLSGPRLWVAHEELIASSRRGDLHVANIIELLNGQDLWDRRLAFSESIAHLGPFPEPWPADFPRPHIRLDDANYAPDFFTLENWWFCSQKLLDAL